MVAFAAATVLGAAIVQPLEPEQRLVITLGLLLLSVAVTLARNGSPRFRAFVAIALVCGAASAWAHEAAQATYSAGKTERYRCMVLGDVQAQNQGSSFLCKLDGGPTVQVEASGSAPRVAAHLLVRGRLEPFDAARNPGEPSEQSMERERGAAARIAAGRILATLPPARLTPAIAIARIHAAALTALHQRLGEPAASILAGELWGDRSSIDPALRAEFQETGTVHVLVTAGLHLGVIAALAIALLRALRVPRIQACATAIAIVWLYAVLSGLHVPAMRAATMLSFALLARAAGAKALSVNAIASAAIVVSLFDPLSVPGASFGLSFACIVAIAAWAEPISDLLASAGSFPERLREALTLTVATQLGTWPLTAAVFCSFSTYALAANLAVVPVVGATMLLGLAQIAFSPIPVVAQAAANLNGWLFAWMIACVHLIASLPNAKVAMTPAPAWAIACYESATVCGALCWRRGGRTVALAAIVTAAALVVAPPRATDYRLRITVLDVGQADSILVQTPLGHAFLIDAGGRLERGAAQAASSSAERVGERTVVPFLLRHGIHRLDALLLSHPHGDHAGGMAPVLRAEGADAFADSGQVYGGFAYRDALFVAHAQRTPIVYPRAGTIWRTNDGVSFRFLAPELPLITGSNNDINNNSLVVLLQYKSFRMLFTGDAGAEAERRILSEGIDLHADVLKVGHHGSAYSSTPEFIDAVRPAYAVISVGRHNMFGHPAPSTVDRLQRSGATVYRTDENGGITITSDGASETVTPMLR